MTTIIDKIDAEIKALQSQKLAIQNDCLHPPIALEEYKWSRSTDEYGREDGPGRHSAKCGLCGKRIFSDVDPRRAGVQSQ